MIEIEFFNKTVESAIRAEQAAYLQRVKSVPFPQNLPTIEEATAEEYAKMSFWEHVLYRYYIRKQRKRLRKALRAQKTPVDERLTKGYNAGVEMALRVLEREFLAFSKTLERLNKI